MLQTVSNHESSGYHEIIESLINGTDRPAANRKTANINVKKLQYIHMLTATDLRTSKTAKIKNSYFTILLHIDVRRCAVI